MTDNDSIFGADEPAPSPAPAPPAPPAAATAVAPPPVADPAAAGTDVEKKAELILEKLFQSGTIVKISVGYWTAKKKLSPKDLGLDEAEVPEEIISLGQKRLVKKSSFEAIKSIEGKARKVAEEYSTESWIPGLRYMTTTAAGKVLPELQTLRTQFYEEMEKFLAKYPDLKAEMLKEYPQYAKALEPHYPSLERVRKSFYFTVDSFKITMARPEADVLTQAKVEIKQNLMDQLDGFLKTTVMDQRALFLEELQTVMEKLQGGDKVHAKTVKKIHEMITVAKEKDFVNDEDFFKLLDTFKEKFTQDNANAKDNDSVKDALGKVLAAAQNTSDVPEVVGKYKRALIVD